MFTSISWNLLILNPQDLRRTKTVLLTCRGPAPYLPELHFRHGQRCIRITWRAENMPMARPTLDLLNQNVQPQTKKKKNPQVILL